jgi:hypothetical protein
MHTRPRIALAVSALLALAALALPGISMASPASAKEASAHHFEASIFIGHQALQDGQVWNGPCTHRVIMTSPDLPRRVTVR